MHGTCARMHLFERRAEGHKQRIQLSSLLRDFTDVSVIIALLGDFHIRRKARMPAAFKRERKSETGEPGEKSIKGEGGGGGGGST